MTEKTVSTLYEVDEFGQRIGRPLNGSMFLAMGNMNGLREILSLWDQWKANRRLPNGKPKWEVVFKQLNVLRRWGIEETLIETQMIDRWRDLVDPISSRRLLSPTETLNAITVGATHTDDSGDVYPQFGQRMDVLLSQLLFSPATRLGLGFRRSIKPDILMQGGRQLYKAPTLEPGSGNWSDQLLKLNRQDGDHNGNHPLFNGR